MAVTTLAKPGDFWATFTFPNTTLPQPILYGITSNGKIYRERRNHDSVGPPTGPGGAGTWVDTGLTIPDVATATDL